MTAPCPKLVLIHCSNACRSVGQLISRSQIICGFECRTARDDV